MAFAAKAPGSMPLLFREVSTPENPSHEELKKRLSALEKELSAALTANRGLTESEELHRLILENISDTVPVTDRQGNFVYICPNTTLIFELTREKVYEV